MHEPNVVGDWQEYDEHAGLRVRVHGVEAAEPPRGRDDAAEGLTYFRCRVTVENRGGEHFGIHLEDGQIDIRIGSDGESALLDWRNSQFIEGYDVYPCAGPPRSSTPRGRTPRCPGWTSRSS